MATSSSFSRYEKSAVLLRALAHPIRLAVVELLFRAGEMEVRAMQAQLGLDQAVLAHHLKILRNQRIVSIHRHELDTHYALCHTDFHLLIAMTERAPDLS